MSPLPSPIPAERVDDAGAPPRSTRSGGCGAAARKAPQGETRTVRDGRTFHTWAPSAYDGTRALPVLVTFHGWGSSGPAFQKWFRMEEHVGGEAIVAYPDSRGATWDFRGDSDLDFFDAMVADLGEAYCVDPSRVFAFGFSYGGRMVHHLACARAGSLRGAAAGGSDWSTKDDRRSCGRVPVLVVHRTRDETELIEWGKKSAAHWAGINGCRGGDRVTDAARGCRAYVGCAAPVAFCEDTHHDRTWPRHWNHTVREEYLDLTWRWLAAVGGP